MAFVQAIYSSPDMPHRGQARSYGMRHMHTFVGVASAARGRYIRWISCAGNNVLPANAGLTRIVVVAALPRIGRTGFIREGGRFTCFDCPGPFATKCVPCLYQNVHVSLHDSGGGGFTGLKSKTQLIERHDQPHHSETSANLIWCVP